MNVLDTKKHRVDFFRKIPYKQKNKGRRGDHEIYVLELDGHAISIHKLSRGNHQIYGNLMRKILRVELGLSRDEYTEIVGCYEDLAFFLRTWSKNGKLPQKFDHESYIKREGLGNTVLS